MVLCWIPLNWAQMNASVETSSGQECFKSMSSVYNRLSRVFWCTPSRGISWQRVVLSWVQLTWAQMYPQKRHLVAKSGIKFDVDFSFCWLNIEVNWWSLEQNIWLNCRQAFNYCCSLHQVWKDTEMHAFIWGLKCLLSMLRCMLGSVKGVESENPKGKGEIRKWK